MQLYKLACVKVCQSHYILYYIIYLLIQTPQEPEFNIIWKESCLNFCSIQLYISYWPCRNVQKLGTWKFISSRMYIQIWVLQPGCLLENEENKYDKFIICGGVLYKLQYTVTQQQQFECIFLWIVQDNCYSHSCNLFRV